jgi:hypothetical protein
MVCREPGVSAERAQGEIAPTAFGTADAGPNVATTAQPSNLRWPTGGQRPRYVYVCLLA